MGGERGDLLFDERAVIEIVVGVVGVPEEHFADLVGFETGGEVLGEVQVVARGGVDGVEGGGLAVRAAGVPSPGWWR